MDMRFDTFLKYGGWVVTIAIGTAAFISWVNAPLQTVIDRVSAVEIIDAQTQVRLTQHEDTFKQLQETDLRLEKKVDALLIRAGINPSQVIQ